MSFFDKLKSEAVGAARRTSGSISQQLSGATSDILDNAAGKSWRVAFEDIPVTLSQLRALPEATLAEPHYAAALLIPALCLWPVDPGAAQEMINFLKGPQPLSPREIQFIGERLRGKEYLPSSYFEGATPENGYEPTRPYAVTVSTTPISFDEAGYAKLYLKSGGADSPRPVQLRQKPSSGEWFLWEQMLLSDIRQPSTADPWA
ncbi:hypothetical protein LJC64_01760 [Ruminococcaceae bacterium OttesenSCG-928-A11]|nr:hypothetical protein [Ruminococcaceae bacterium OttesenSCG-928-A11]